MAFIALWQASDTLEERVWAEEPVSLVAWSAVAEVPSVSVDVLFPLTQSRSLPKTLLEGLACSDCLGGSSSSWSTSKTDSGSAIRIISPTTSNISSSSTPCHLPPMVCTRVPVMVRISIRTGASAQLVLVRR